MSENLEVCAGYLQEKKCPVCGKIFYCNVTEAEWAYHYARQKGSAIVCSWSCARQSEQKYTAQKKESRKNKNNGSYSGAHALIVETEQYRQFLQIEKCKMAHLLGVAGSSYSNWTRGIKNPAPERREQINAFLERNWRNIK